MNARLITIKGHYVAVLAALFSFVCYGCGRSDNAKVTGKLLRRDGTPVVNAKVIARSKETGKSASASTNDEGDFAIGAVDQGNGLPPGDYAVVIVEDRGDPDHRRRPTIAAKYRDPDKSGVSVSVKPGENKKLDLTLDSL